MQAVMMFRLPALVEKDGAEYVSTCPILGVSSQGKTKKAALDNLKEALELFLVSCFERGTLEQVLKESGFKPAAAASFKEKKYASKYNSINVPLPFNVPLSPHPVDCPA